MNRSFHRKNCRRKSSVLCAENVRSRTMSPRSETVGHTRSKSSYWICKTLGLPSSTVFFFNSLLWISLVLSSNFIRIINAKNADVDQFYFTREPAASTLTVSGKPATLDCVAFYKDARGKSLVVPEIHWTREVGEGQPGTRLVDSVRRYTLSNGSLHLEEVTDPANTGYYRCVATVKGVGTIVSREAKLVVSYLRHPLDREPSDLALALGDTAAFECLVDSQPAAQVTWYKGSRRVQQAQGDDVTVYPSGLLELRNIKPSDYSSYVCHVQVEGGHRTTSRAAVLSQLPSTDLKLRGAPKFVIRPRDQRAVQGETIYLHCVAYGRDRKGRSPIISWLKDGRTLTTGNPGGRLETVGSGTLIIKGVTSSDSGVYTCRADNLDDTSDVDAALIVLAPPTIVVRPSGVISPVNDDITLQCHTEGVPTPKVTWYKDGIPIMPGNYHQPLADGSLQIMGLMLGDAGMYQCIAGNELGEVQAGAEVKVVPRGQLHTNTRRTIQHTIDTLSASNHQPYALAAGGVYTEARDKPPTPVDLRAVLVSTRFVTVAWHLEDGSGGSQGDGILYSVKWREVGSQRERVSNTTAKEFSMQGLRPHTEYTVWVRSFNSDGPSQGEASTTVTTKPEVLVPSAPRRLTATPVSSTEIRVEWSEPIITFGKIQAYEIFYYTDGSKEEKMTVTEKESKNLKGLEEYSLYKLRVAAINTQGMGSSTEEVEVRTYSDKPSKPPQNFTVEVASSSSLVVRWLPPPLVHQNGIITGYKIRRRRKGSKQGGTTLTTAGDRNTYALTELKKDTDYQVRISAITANGTGPVTHWETARTLREDLDESTPPGQPAELHTVATATSIEVSWAPPLWPRNVLVRGYLLGYGKGVPKVFKMNFGAEKRHHVIKNLRPSEAYIISVQAFNKRGQGEERLDHVMTTSFEETPITPMSTPLALKAKVMSASTVVLTWTDSALSDNQLINDNRYYTINYRPNTGRSKKWLTDKATELNKHIHGLKPYTEYEFRVKVTKGERWSHWSLSVFATTDEKAPASEPRDLTPVSLGPDNPLAVGLNWQPPARPNGQITGYLIYYANHLHTEESVWPVEGVDGESLSTVIDNLTPDTTYFFKVRARNAKGDGPKSSSVKFITPPAAQKAQAGEQEDGGFGLSLPIIAGACVGIVFIICIVILGIVCLCRRNSQPGAMTKTTKVPPPQTQTGGMKPPDLWTHQPSNLELNKLGRSNRSESSASVATSTLRRGSRGSADHTDDLGSTLDRRRNSFIGEGGYPSSGEERYQPIQPRNLIRPKPVMMPIDPMNHGMPPSMLQYGADVPPGAPLPMRPIYPRTQYSSQYSGTPYGNPARVNAGDLPHSCPSSSKQSLSVVAETERDGDLPSSMEDSYHSRIGYVKPQQNISPYRKPSGPITASTPNKGQKTPVPFNSKSPETKIKKEDADLSKSLSTEELTAEMANLEGLMKDLNAITQQEFEC